jgi:hypothetical protein
VRVTGEYTHRYKKELTDKDERVVKALAQHRTSTLFNDEFENGDVVPHKNMKVVFSLLNAEYIDERVKDIIHQIGYPTRKLPSFFFVIFRSIFSNNMNRHVCVCVFLVSENHLLYYSR